MTPDDASVGALNLCFNVLMKFSLALPWDVCLKKVLHWIVGLPAAISLFGADAFKIRFRTDSSNFENPSFLLILLNEQ
jgi:hypothetical protein